MEDDSELTTAPTCTVALTCLLFGAGLGGTAACDRSSPSGAEEAERESPAIGATAGEEEPAAQGEASSVRWERVGEESLGAEARGQLERARSARDELASTLKGELQSAVSEHSFAGAVSFCRDRAPEIAASVGENRGVKIGRTSHRLRNPDNAPPEWASDPVGRREAREYTFRGPEEELGYLHPIKLKGMCVNCHGSQGQLAPGVSAALVEDYPRDRATGFEPGDLRGWFWVEVPRGDS